MTKIFYFWLTVTLQMKEREQVFDPLRKKYVALTPEERVRQSFIRWLNDARGYPLSLMASEYSIQLGKKDFRCDIVCFSSNLQPLLAVECKAPHVKLECEAAEQICRYNMVLKVRYLVITNGVTTFAFELDPESGSYRYISDIPSYAECRVSK